MTSTATPASSFMKQVRAAYRVRGGKMLFALGVLLFLLLGLLLAQIDVHVFKDMTTPQAVNFILIDLAALVLLLAYAVMYRATLLWRRSRDGQIGTRLQSRIILMFTIIAILPTLVVAAFSILFFNVGIKNWFDTQVKEALQDSVSVATAYIEEHKEAIRADAVGLGQAVRNQLTLSYSNPALFSELLNQQAGEHNVAEAIVFDHTRVMARTALSFSLMFERLPESVLARADSGQVTIFGDDQDKIQAVVKIANMPDVYLMVVRVVDPQVLKHMEAARETVTDYKTLQTALSVLQKQLFIVFVLIALLVLLASLWAGMLLAVRLIEPLRALMAATERVRAGDYSIRVPEGRAEDEIANLGRTFNRMTGQLETQRRDLMDANRLADERRRFTEAVLSGVSAGVIALDSAKKITLHNRVALELLDTEALLKQPIAQAAPDIAALVAQAEKKPDRIASGDVVLAQGERRRTLHVQVTAERFDGSIEGYIVTFDDITALVSAQRNAAWADVARRIAHEIKNPLTPITLSAERLRKKFSAEISDKESYDKYLDTIARHVRDIGRMVEEFVSFARLPASVFREENVAGIIRKSVFSEKTVHPEIAYVTELPEKPVMLAVDESQFGQMLLNLLKNAAEALEGSDKKEILIALSESEHEVRLFVGDSGPGFPPDKIERLTEPYVTTRMKGTGLGLAIVKRTVEEHKGTLTLSNREGGGAGVTIVFTKV